MPLRSLRIVIDDLLDAIDHHGDEATPFLNLTTGAIEYWNELLDEDDGGDGEHGGVDPEDPQWREVPRRESHEAFRAMEQFAAELDEPDVQEQLGIALGGRGAFRRFRDVLARHPDLQQRWQQQERATLLRRAHAWLAALDIEPIDEPRAVPLPPQQPAAATPTPRLTLTDVLLLGSPNGKTEILGGRVTREYHAPDAGRARAAFKALAREVTEQAGIGWRNRFVDGRDRYELGRFELTLDGAIVRLRVEMPPAVRELFRRP